MREGDKVVVSVRGPSIFFSFSGILSYDGYNTKTKNSYR